MTVVDCSFAPSGSRSLARRGRARDDKKLGTVVRLYLNPVAAGNRKSLELRHCFLPLHSETYVTDSLLSVA